MTYLVGRKLLKGGFHSPDDGKRCRTYFTVAKVVQGNRKVRKSRDGLWTREGA